MALVASQCPYAAGKALTLQVDKQGPTNASIINVFEPFTMSCVMIVQLDHPAFKGQFTLKLYDRRFATQLRRDEKASPWCPQIESKYREFDSASEYFNCPAILLEHIHGFPLITLADNAPGKDWQYICEDVIRVVHLVGDRGVCNKDVKTSSFIIREDPDTKKFKAFMTDVGLCAFRSQAKSDREFNEWQADQDKEGAIGRVMQKVLKGGFNYQLSARAEWLLDEFKSEE